MATLAEEIRALLQSIGPDLIPQAQGLPAVAPQSMQSGNPTPQNVGQTLGPQPGDPRNATRQQLGQEFTQAAGSFAASAADPLGIPSAVTGMFSPQMRDQWRQYQGAAGMGPQMAGGLLSGYGAVGGLMRGGNALAGNAGMVAGGAASGLAPTIDYAADTAQGTPGASGSDLTNALAGPLGGAALPAGIAAAPRIMNAIRGNPTAAAAGGATALAAGSAVAQQQQPPLDEFTRNLHANNPALAASYQNLLRARQAALAANRTSVDENAGKKKNTGAKEGAGRADTAAEEAQRAYEELLARATDAARAANPSFREAYGPVLSNRLVRSTAIPFALGLVGGAGAASLGRITNRMARSEVAAGNAAMEVGNTAQAATAAGNANALANPGGSSWAQRILPPAGMGLSAAIGAEGALMPQQWNQEAPRGSPDRIDADAYMGSWRPWVDGALGAVLGASAFKGGRYVAQQGNNLLPGQNRVPPINEAAALQRRVNAPPAPAQPQVVPPVIAPVSPIQPPANNLPVDFEAIVRDIGGAARNTRGPRGSNPNAPGLSYTPESNGAAMFRDEVAKHLRSGGGSLTGFNVADFRRRVVAAAEADGASATAVPSARVFSDALRRLQALIDDQGLSATQAAQRLTRARRSGGFENFAIAPIAIGGGTVHHSMSQPRGDDGRFTSPE